MHNDIGLQYNFYFKEEIIMLRKKADVLVAAVSIAFAGSTLAAVGADEAKLLGGADLTMVGAEKAGNKDGTIPAYTGEGVKPPASYNPKRPGWKPDPWNEKPLFAITAQNYTQYAERLTEGQKALFKTYPQFRMDIYPTHRTASFPKYVLDNTVKNATSCKGAENELKLEGCYAGIPFPVPKTGNQVMWNHLAGFEAPSWVGVSSNWLVAPKNPPVLQAISLAIQESAFYNPKNTGVNGPKDLYWKVRTNDTAPARKAGEKILILDALDQLNIGRRAYQYIPGQRRVKLAPDLSYDTPNPYTGGVSTMDEAKGFVGSLDRYDWKLIGKKEKYILYNAFALNDHNTCPDEKLTATKNFPNPDCIRWELHRVWIVQGTLKPGFRHIYAKRTYYWDEDGYLAGQGENYDAGGKLYRVAVPLHTPFFNGVGATVGGAYYMDLQNGIWAINGGGSCADDECGWHINASMGDNYYSPDAMAGEGIR